MANKKIAESLKYYRKQNDLSVQAVSELLKAQNITAAPKTIYGWEGGRTSPTADTLMTLCKIYHVEDMLSAFGYAESEENTRKELTEEEWEVIQAYRSLPQLQDSVKRVLGIWPEKKI